MRSCGSAASEFGGPVMIVELSIGSASYLRRSQTTLAKVAFDRDSRNSDGMAPKGVESLLALAFSTHTTIGTQNDSA